MVFRKISKDLKERAIWLLDHGWLKDDILQILGISESSLKRWRRHVRHHGSVIPPRNLLQGRPSVLDALQIHELTLAICESPELFLDEIRDWVLVSMDIGLSRATISRIIKDLGFTYKHLHKVAIERDEELRQEWMEEIQSEFVAEQMVFVDESSKDERTIYRRFGRAPKGQDATVSAKFVRGTRYSIIAAITTEGYLATRIVEGSVDGTEFIDYILEEVESHLLQLCSTSVLTTTKLEAPKDESFSARSKCIDIRQLCYSQVRYAA